jgi:3-hydroxyacyl-[acyl-carrier-protein] dehydratase
LSPLPTHPAGSFRVPVDHPALAGHFPGHPMVPGVVLLDRALTLIAARLEGLTVIGLNTVKFTAIVLPEQQVEVRYEPLADSRVDFACLSDDAVVVRGTAILRRPT